MQAIRGVSASASPVAPPAPARRVRTRRLGSAGAGTLSPPWDDRGGSGGGGGGERGSGEGGDGAGSRARLGLYLALLAMSTLFGAFLIAYLLLRRSAPIWPPPGAPVPPKGLWISTLVLAGSSATLVLALRAGRTLDARRLSRWLDTTLGLGVAFLVVQAILWRDVFAGGRTTATDAYGTIFYSLTGLHGAHVIGGLVCLARTSGRARREPTGARTRLALALCSTYWHFMAAVWLVIFAVLYFLN